MTALVWSLRIMLGAIFVVSSMPKLLAPRQLMKDVQNYRILPPRLASAYGRALGPVEFVVGFSLLSGYGGQWGGVVATALLATFLTAVGIAMHRKQNLTCTCFGLLYRERVGWPTQGRDGLLIAMAVTVALGGAETPPLWEMMTARSIIGLAGALTILIVCMTAVGLGWVAAKGWPRWITGA